MNEFTIALLFRVVARITMTITMATTTTVVAFDVVFTIFSLNRRLSSDTLQTWWHLFVFLKFNYPVSTEKPPRNKCLLQSLQLQENKNETL